MAEKELAYISIGIIILVFIVFFSLLYYTLGDRAAPGLDSVPSPLLELNEEKDLR